MIQLKRLVKEALNEILSEELPLSMAKGVMKMKRSPEAEKLLNKIFTKLAALPNAKISKRGDRVYIPFKGSGSVTKKTNSHEDEISKFLKDNDYELLDYKKGLAKDPYGRQIKLGKALTKLKNKELLNKFNNDKSRESIKNEGSSYLVFSRHKYDIAGMSTNRGWESCMNLISKKKGKIYVPSDIEHGTFIVYLVKSDDLNINNPVARVLVKPFFNKDNEKEVVYFPEKKVYGTAPSSFIPTVKKIVQSTQNILDGLYMLKSDLYCDSEESYLLFTLPPDMNLKELPKTKDELIRRLQLFKIDLSKVSIHSDLSITYNDSLLINRTTPLSKVEELPFKFRAVNGSFHVGYANFKTLKNFPSVVTGEFRIRHSFNLKTLEGGPKKVLGNCDCSRNRLISLNGAPNVVVGDFICFLNKLKILEGGPKEVGGEYDCSNNGLVSLKGAPSKVGRSFICANNRLNVLEEGPKYVGGDYDCINNSLVTLKGAPVKVPGDFNCIFNKLRTLEGGPKEVGKNYKCAANKLVSLKGAPKYVGGSFSCFSNNVKFTEEDIRAVTNVGKEVLV